MGRITQRNFRACLDDLGYYNGDTFGSAEDVREYLTVKNINIMFGEDSHSFTDEQLAQLADMAIEHREHWAE